MTDLEKLYEDLVSLDAKARAAGRIEGLKEAMRNVCILCREGKVISDDHFHPMIMAVGQIHYELCQASRIHAIVRELEGNK